MNSNLVVVKVIVAISGLTSAVITRFVTDAYWGIV